MAAKELPADLIAIGVSHRSWADKTLGEIREIGNEVIKMKTIKILGTGCASCKQTESIIRETLVELGVSANIEKIEDIEQIMAYDVMSTPAVVLDEQIMIRGKVPTREEVRAMLA